MYTEHRGVLRLDARISLLPDQANKSGNHYPYNISFYSLDNIISNAVTYYVVPELGPSAPTGAEKKRGTSIAYQIKENGMGTKCTLYGIEENGIKINPKN